MKPRNLHIHFLQVPAPITGAPSINGLGSRSSGGGGTAANPNVLVSNIHVSKNLKVAFVQSVESRYQGMVKVNSDGMVTINISDERMDKILSSHSSSNFGALLSLVYMQTKIDVRDISRNEKIKIDRGDHGGWDGSLNDFMNFVGPIIWGITLHAAPSIPEPSWAYDANSFGDMANYSDLNEVLVDMSGFAACRYTVPQIIAHEIYCHVYLYAMGIWWGHGVKYVDKRARRVEIQALPPKK